VERQRHSERTPEETKTHIQKKIIGMQIKCRVFSTKQQSLGTLSHAEVSRKSKSFSLLCKIELISSRRTGGKKDNYHTHISSHGPFRSCGFRIGSMD
jgi:hypothetical protein